MADGIHNIKKQVLKIRPTVIIGLGGTGGKVLMDIRRRFFEKYGSLDNFPIISYLWIDTDGGEPGKIPDAINSDISFTPTEQLLASVEDTSAVTSNFQDYTGIEQWWYHGLNDLGSVKAGANQIRAYGRMAFSVNYANIKSSINAAVAKVNNVNVMPRMIESTKLQAEAFDQSTTEVIIVNSAAGGTGSGMFLDVCFLIKNEQPTANVTAHVVLPGMLGAIVVGQDRMLANGYAFLKELDYYEYGDHNFEAKWDNQNRVSVSVPAVANLYLYDGHNCYNVASNQPEFIYETIADSIFKDYSHGGFGDQKRSTAVNFAQFLTNTWNMKLANFTQVFTCRYLSAGFSSIVMPHDRIRLACAYRLASEVVASWSQNAEVAIDAELATDTCQKGMVALQVAPNPKTENGRVSPGLGLMSSLLDSNNGEDQTKDLIKDQTNCQTNSLLVSLFKTASEVLDNASNGRTPNAIDSYEYVKATIEDLEARLQRTDDNSLKCGEYARIIRTNRNKLVDYLLGHKQDNVFISVKNWAISLVEQEGLSFGFVRQVINNLEIELVKLIEKYKLLQKDTGALMQAKKQEYAKAMKSLYSACHPGIFSFCNI